MLRPDGAHPAALRYTRRPRTAERHKTHSARQNADPHSKNIDPDAGQPDPDMGRTDPDAGRPDPDTGQRIRTRASGSGHEPADPDMSQPIRTRASGSGRPARPIDAQTDPFSCFFLKAGLRRARHRRRSLTPPEVSAMAISTPATDLKRLHRCFGEEDGTTDVCRTGGPGVCRSRRIRAASTLAVRCSDCRRLPIGATLDYTPRPK
jgi:hypothetical protein